jgi:high-affinity Fe2+/Pb2+ permease
MSPNDAYRGESGFSVVELFIIIVVLILVGGALWLIYREHNNANSTHSSTVSCPVGEKLAESAATGKQYCVNANYQGTTD